ncbi:MAG TPA: glycosyltransferase family 4 protein [Gemmatimonadaceae bacterium]|nr:glycosyltransferase family 4 protein [Gemmatimonadaceae bacterium]
MQPESILPRRMTHGESPSRTKVTFCVYDNPGHVGGPVTWIVRLLPALRNLGIDVNCLFLLHWGETGPALESLRAQGFHCESVVCHPRTEDRVRWILERLKENPPDVFVPNLVLAAYFAGRWTRAAGIPTVGVVHSDDAFYRALQDDFVFGPSAFRLAALVCVSRQLELEVLARKPVETAVHRIPCGAPIPDARVQPASHLRIAYLGRLADEQKRISDVTRSLCRVVREVSGTEAVIYGNGPDANRVTEILESDGRDLPIRLGGSIPSEFIQDRLLECDVVVLLSDYEGLPIALMEAMACGCVPVCLRIRSGIPELVEDGVTGLLVDDRGDDFVRAIRTLRENPELLASLSAAARSRVERSYSNDDCAERWAVLLRELGSRSSPRRRFRVPSRIRLLPQNPFLESAELRRPKPSIPLRFYRRSRMIAGRVKRVLLGRPRT